MQPEQRVIVLLNSVAGAGGAGAERYREALEAVGIEVVVREVAPADLGSAARRAAAERAGTVVAAGGDGTVAAVASALVDSTTALGVLPAGTLNHFAGDLHLPLDLLGAAQVIARGRTRRVDVGEVNGRFFLNNASIGLYPRIVAKRDSQRQRLGRGKWFAMALAAISVFRRYPLVHVSMRMNDQIVRCTTPIVFVGNNRYETSLLNLGRRSALDGKELCVYFAIATGRLSLLRLGLRAILGRLKQDRDFRMLIVDRLTLETRRRKIRMALDGEVVPMEPPLEFRVRAGALLVLAGWEERHAAESEMKIAK
jgi:diacylglycerol kinase family enzyme